jgi:hypothetical protein
VAYSVGKTSALQTAIKAAVDITLAELSAGIILDPVTHEAIMARVNEVKDSLTPELFAQVDEDNGTFAASGGSGKSVPTPSGPIISLEEAKQMVLNFGMFKGMTLENIAAMTGDEVKAYTNGKRDSAGISYVKWVAGNTDPKAKFAADRAKLVLADYEATGAALAALARKT